MRTTLIVAVLAVLLPFGAQAKQCHPAYKGVCLPIVDDIDCYGGGGKGPVFVKGPFSYEGDDVYGLDRDGNGIACEPFDLDKVLGSKGG